MTTSYPNLPPDSNDPSAILALGRREFLASLISLIAGVSLAGMVPGEASAAEAQEGTIPVPGAELFYKSEGAGEPLLLISGFSCDQTIWDTFAPLLHSRFRVIRFDNRGIGRSTTAAGKSVDVSGLTVNGMAEDAVAVLSALGIARAHVVGHSMGGQIAQELCIQAGDRVASLSLLSSWAKPDARLSWLIRLFGDLADRLAPEDYVRVLLPWMFTEDAFTAMPQAMEGAVRRWVNNPQRPTPALLRAQCNAILASDTSARLPDIRTPTFVSVAHGDSLTPPQLSRVLAAGIFGAAYFESDAGAHAFILDAASEIVSRLIPFLDAHPVGP
jgi:3-oxoadipate enol-lactonase